MLVRDPNPSSPCRGAKQIPQRWHVVTHYTKARWIRSVRSKISDVAGRYLDCGVFEHCAQ